MAQSRKKKIEQHNSADAISLEGLEPLLENASLDIVQDFTPTQENASLQAQPVTDYRPARKYGLSRFLLPEPMDFRPATPAPVVQKPAVNETRLILDLLTQLESVNELVLETSYQLECTRSRIKEMEAQLMGEEILVEKIRALELETQRVLELETWLDAVRAENENLKRPVWKKMFGVK